MLVSAIGPSKAMSLLDSSTVTVLNSVDEAAGPSVVDRRKPGRNFGNDGMPVVLRDRKKTVNTKK